MPVKTQPGFPKGGELWVSEGWDGHASGTYPTSVTDYRLRTVGENTPDFFRRKKAGELLPHTEFVQSGINEFEYDLWTVRSVHSTLPQYWYQVTNFNTGVDTSPRLYHSPNLAGIQAEVQRAASNIMTSGMDALTFLAEFNKTADQFRNVTKTLGKLLTQKKRVARNFSRAWLEGRYGWRTLAYDVRDLHYAVTEFDRTRTIWTERAGYSYTEQTLQSPSYAMHPNIGTYRGWLKFTTRHSLRGSVGALVLPARFQANPIQTAWELVPLSFVIDWVILVGDAINAMNLVLSADATTASFGHYSETTCEGGSTSIVPADPAYNAEIVKHARVRWVYFANSRTPTDIPLKPQLSNRLIQPNNIVDLTTLYRAKVDIGKLR